MAAQPASEPQTSASIAPVVTAPTTRSRDPWVFRSVLDGQPRTVTIALADDLWVAYDAQTCSLRKVWAGGVEFTGSVYDTKHGPQPKSKGDSIFASNSSWMVLEGDVRTMAPVRYLGYRFVSGGVVLRYEVTAKSGSPVLVDERPERASAGHTLYRTFTITGLKGNEKIALVFTSLDTEMASKFPNSCNYFEFNENGTQVVSMLLNGRAK